METIFNFENIKEVNATIKKTDIKGKQYAEVAQRIQALRQLLPDCSITTEIINFDGNSILCKSSVIYGGVVLATGLAFEQRTSTGVNSTSFVENCETSAVGRAIGMLGIGSEEAICSVEELNNAIKSQNDLISIKKKIIEEAKEKVKDAETLSLFKENNKQYISQFGKPLEDFLANLLPKEQKEQK